MKGNKFSLRLTTILFTGLLGSDVHACKQMIMDKPFESQHPLGPIQSGTTNLEFSYYTVSGEKIKLLDDNDLDMVFACNTAIKIETSFDNSIQKDFEASNTSNKEAAPESIPNKEFANRSASVNGDLVVRNDAVYIKIQKGTVTKNEKSDELPVLESHHPTELVMLEASNSSAKSKKEEEPLDKEVVVPEPIPHEEFTNPPSVHIQTYEPISKKSLLKCATTEKILQLMDNQSLAIVDNLDIINCVYCSDVWLLEVLPIFLSSITISIMSLTQNLKEKIFLQKFKTTVPGEEIQISLTNEQLIKDISVISTELIVVEKQSEFELINEGKSEVVLEDHEEKAVYEARLFKAGKSIRKMENIKRQIISSLALSELKQVSLSWHMFGHAIKKVMQQYKKLFISKQEVLIIATEFRISIIDVEIALINLHMCGLILYYGSVLPNVIFKDSTTFLELIAKINLFAIQHNQGAIIPLTAFEVCKDMYAEGLFTCKEAISLFKDLHLLIELKYSLFLMPCLLREEVSVETFSSVCGLKDTKVAPLVIQCSLARGSFEYIMCYLCSQYNSHPWPWKIGVLRDLFKNCVQFILPGVNALINLYRKKDAEMTVWVNSNSMQDYELLPFIRTAIVTGLNKAAEAFHVTGEALSVVGFHCACDQVDYTHMIVPSKDDHWRCSATNERLVLYSAQDIWFTKVHDGGKYNYYLKNMITIFGRKLNI